ncbi:tpr repeat-containing protein [Stylonychia lemnae]|uniref:Tpr repeat-containing protein n=1 Tax=Stylonychia lemnae TaxID=5949 RepID=A0A078AEC5_STYLE|nr:tpr repeat-containing protein [Stylonychia lemnae]|eukprot:CDW79852.1 tpr repeat-containing protein [Stylonychia lemnae]
MAGLNKTLSGGVGQSKVQKNVFYDHLNQSIMAADQDETKEKAVEFSNNKINQSQMRSTYRIKRQKRLNSSNPATKNRGSIITSAKMSQLSSVMMNEMQSTRPNTGHMQSRHPSQSYRYHKHMNSSANSNQFHYQQSSIDAYNQASSPSMKAGNIYSSGIIQKEQLEDSQKIDIKSDIQKLKDLKYSQSKGDFTIAFESQKLKSQRKHLQSAKYSIKNHSSLHSQKQKHQQQKQHQPTDVQSQFSKQETNFTENQSQQHYEKIIQMKVLEIESNIMERAQKQFEQINEKKKVNSLNIAQEVNYLTYKVRVQNGGPLMGQLSSQKYPLEQDVRKVKNLDMTPSAATDLENKIIFDHFTVNQKFKPNSNQTDTFNLNQHMPSLNAQIDPDTKFTTKLKASLSPKKSTNNKQSLLLQQLREIKEKFAKQDSSSVKQMSIEQEFLKKSISRPQDQSVNTSFIKNMIKKPAKRFSVEDRLRMQLEQNKDDKFMRIPATSNRMRMVFNEIKVPPQDLNRQGFKKIGLNDMHFDPLRLKVLVIPFKDANPIGKNADYFFLKGFKYQTNEEYANALHSYQKGLEIKHNHLLCRFNLGVILFRLGLFEEAYLQYEKLISLGYHERTVVLYNKILCAVQIGRFNEAVEIATKCIDILIKRKRGIESDKEMIGDLHQIIGICHLRLKNIKLAGKSFAESRNYKTVRQKELSIVFKKSLSKQIQDRLMEYLRNKTVSYRDSIQTGNSIRMGEKLIEDNSIQVVELKLKKKQKSRDQSSPLRDPSRTRNKIQHNDNENNNQEGGIIGVDQSQLLRTYLTEAERKSALDRMYNVEDTDQNPLGKRRKSLPQPDIFVLDVYEEQNVSRMSDSDSGSSDTALNQVKAVEQKAIEVIQQKPKEVDKMNIQELMNEVQNLVDLRSDPERGYFYINDEKEVRLEKIFDIPSLFKKPKPNDYTQQEMEIKNHRENLENYLNPQKNFDNSLMDTAQLVNEEEAKYNFYLENIFKLQERDPNKEKDQSETDEKTYQIILQQISSFSEKIDKSFGVGEDPKKQEDQQQEQEQVQNLNVNHDMNNNMKRLNDAESNINQLKSIFSKQKENKDLKKEYDKLTVQELEQFCEEFQKQDKDMDLLESILNKLNGFKYMSLEMKSLILRRAQLKQYDPNKILYRQGTRGSVYYFLLRGSITLLSKRREFGNFELFIKSQYDGELFGEQPVLLPTSATATASEGGDSTEGMQVSEDLADNSKEYIKNLNCLRKLPIFKYTETFYLLQMVFSLEKRTYKYGEYLSRSGEIPEGMHIITKGQCLCVFESIGLKKGELGGEFSRFQKQPKNFQCGTILETHNMKAKDKNSNEENKMSQVIKPKSENLSIFNPQYSVFNQLIGDNNRNFQSSRIYLDDEGRHMPKHTAYQDNVIFSRLVPGDTFGMRTLLPNEEIVKRIQIDPEDKKRGQIMSVFSRRSTIRKMLNNFKKNEGPQFNQVYMNLFRKLIKNQKTSSLSVFADSNEVEVLIFKPNVLNYMPEDQKDSLFEDISKNIDADNPSSLSNILRQKSESQGWDKLKEDLVQNMRKSQFMERHKGVYKR